MESEQGGARWWTAIAVLALIVVVGSIWRDAGTAAHVFADERTYSYFSRAGSLSAASIPSYFYFLVFSSTRSCRDDGLACARLLNVLFFAGALPFLFFTARRFTSERLAFLLTLLTALGPLTSYTAYFMPESMYFFGVWVLLFTLTTPALGWGVAIGVGLTLGLLSLVKLHGLFLVPAALVVLVARSVFAEQWKRSLGFAAVAGLLTFAVRLGGGFAFAGTAGLSVLGEQYAAANSQAHALGELMLLSASVAGRHVEAVAIVFALPLAVLLSGARFRFTDDERQLDPRWLSVLFLLPLLLIAALFTAKIAGAGEHESDARVHQRYYNFAFPLLTLCAATLLRAGSARSSPTRSSIAIALGVIGLGVHALVSRASSAALNMVDCPDLSALGSRVFTVGAILGLVAVALWAWRPAWGSALWLFLAFPIMVAAGTVVTTRELRVTGRPSLVDTAPAVVRKLLSREDLNRLQVVAPSEVDGFRALFVLNNEVGAFVVNDGTTPVRQTDPSRPWYLIFGAPPVEGKHTVVLAQPEFSLVRFD